MDPEANIPLKMNQTRAEILDAQNSGLHGQLIRHWKELSAIQAWSVSITPSSELALHMSSRRRIDVGDTHQAQCMYKEITFIISNHI